MRTQLKPANAGFPVILIDCSYNQGSLPSNAVRVADWYQVERIIARMSSASQSVFGLEFDAGF
jgi:uncharacterized HAD superfamily protein